MKPCFYFVSLIRKKAKEHALLTGKQGRRHYKLGRHPFTILSASNYTFKEILTLLGSKYNVRTSAISEVRSTIHMSKQVTFIGGGEPKRISSLIQDLHSTIWSITKNLEEQLDFSHYVHKEILALFTVSQIGEDSVFTSSFKDSYLDMEPKY